MPAEQDGTGLGAINHFQFYLNLENVVESWLNHVESLRCGKKVMGWTSPCLFLAHGHWRSPQRYTQPLFAATAWNSQPTHGRRPWCNPHEMPLDFTWRLESQVVSTTFGLAEHGYGWSRGYGWSICFGIRFSTMTLVLYHEIAMHWCKFPISSTQHDYSHASLCCWRYSHYRIFGNQKRPWKIHEHSS